MGLAADITFIRNRIVFLEERVILLTTEIAAMRAEMATRAQLELVLANQNELLASHAQHAVDIAAMKASIALILAAVTGNAHPH